MILGKASGRLLSAALLPSVITMGAAHAETMLRVEHPDGSVLVNEPAPPGTEWCLWWRHSVTGGAVADCFTNVGDRMILARSFLHDFAAGLGTVQGRSGRLVSATGGGYWIEGINETIPDNALVLRVGAPPVDHRIEIGRKQHALSPVAAGQRVIIRLDDGE